MSVPQEANNGVTRSGQDYISFSVSTWATEEGDRSVADPPAPQPAPDHGKTEGKVVFPFSCDSSIIVLCIQEFSRAYLIPDENSWFKRCSCRFLRFWEHCFG